MATAVLDRLEEELAELCGHVNALNASIVRVVAKAMDSGGWHGPGLHSPAHWVAWKTGVSMAQARRIMRLVERRGELPATFTAFEAGELSIDQVTPIVERAPAYADRQLCEFARSATVTQIRRVVRAYPFDPDPTTTVKPPKPRGESFSWLQGDDGRWWLRGELDADHGMILDAALREARDALFQANGATSNVEALVELAERSLDSVTSTGRRDRFRIHVHVTADGQMRDPFGHIIDTAVRQQLTCDAIWSTTYTEAGLPISVGRAQYVIPERTRREVLRRDGGRCVVPGCTGHGHYLEVHHIVHREDGGGHDTWNLVCLCPRHHRMHHRGLLGISGNADVPDGLELTDANGHPIRAGPTIRPPTGPPPWPAGRYRHPSGERLDTRSIAFNPPPPPPAA